MPSRTVLLTGCTRGLGEAMTHAFAELGHTVLGCARDARRVAALGKKWAPPHAFAVVDVADRGAVQRWADTLLSRHGPPDLLLNNAAVIHPNGRFWEVPPADFDRVIDVNVRGMANVLRAFLPTMVRARRGVIVNFSSGWGRSTAPEVSGYCASKYAVEGLTASLAQELPRGMAAVALSPGVINTDMLRQCFGNASAARCPSPGSWAQRAVPYLLKLGPNHNGRSLSVPGLPVD